MTVGEANVSINFKDANGVQYTIRANSPTEFMQRVDEIEQVAMPLGVTALLSLFGVESKHPQHSMAVAQAFGGNTQVVESYETAPGFAPVPPPVQPAQPQYQPTSYANAPVAAGMRNCAHGVMVKREGEGQYGPYKGYYCPTPKGTPNQCKPIYLKKGTPDWDAF
jgi:hypothetical protein